MWEISKFKLLLLRGINTVHGFSCTRNAVCMYILCRVITVRSISEGLVKHSFSPNQVLRTFSNYCERNPYYYSERNSLYNENGFQTHFTSMFENYPLIIPEYPWFSDTFRGYRNKKLVLNGLKRIFFFKCSK